MPRAETPERGSELVLVLGQQAGFRLEALALADVPAGCCRPGCRLPTGPVGRAGLGQAHVHSSTSRAVQLLVECMSFALHRMTIMLLPAGEHGASTSSKESSGTRHVLLYACETHSVHD